LSTDIISWFKVLLLGRGLALRFGDLPAITHTVTRIAARGVGGRVVEDLLGCA